MRPAVGLRVAGRSAGLETRDTADLEVCATGVVRESARHFLEIFLPAARRAGDTGSLAGEFVARKWEGRN